MPPQEKICYGPFITNIGISFTSYIEPVPKDIETF